MAAVPYIHNVGKQVQKLQNSTLMDRNLRKWYKTTSDGAAIEQARKQLENAQKFEGSPLEKKMNVLMGQIGIDYSRLTKDEQMTLLRVFNKSSMLKHRAKLM